MSWDVMLMNVSPTIVTGDDFPEDFTSELGPRAQVLSRMTAILPSLDLTDPTWGILDGDDFFIEFNIGDRDPVDVMTLHIRGGNGVISVIQRICEHTGWRAFDTSTGDFIDFTANPAEGLHQWRASRDQVVASLEAEGKQVVTDVKVNKTGVDIMEITAPKRKKWWAFWK